MPERGSLFVSLSELRSVFLVAIGVAMLFTVAAAAFEQFHQVAAEDINAHEVAAVAGPDATQVLNLSNWGVALKLPMGKGLPLLSWSSEGVGSVGLSAAALEELGANCTAQKNALGAVLQVPAGSFAKYPSSAQTEVFLASVNGHDYVYQMPKTTCAGVDTAANLTAQAEAAVEGSGVLTPSGQ